MSMNDVPRHGRESTGSCATAPDASLARREKTQLCFFPPRPVITWTKHTPVWACARVRDERSCVSSPYLDNLSVDNPDSLMTRLEQVLSRGPKPREGAEFEPLAQPLRRLALGPRKPTVDLRVDIGVA
jgi:hypothetical protein